MSRDSQREKVYQAEYRLRDLYDTAEKIGNPVITLDGITLTLPPEAKFGDLSSIQRYVDLVVGKDKVKVRERKGALNAHYEAATRTIAIHTETNRWAMRELVVLHELAHHLTRTEHGQGGHGPAFTAAYGTLMGDTMGPEVGLVYRILCAHSGAK